MHTAWFSKFPPLSKCADHSSSYHEVSYGAMKDGVVVVAVQTVLQEILTRLGNLNSADENQAEVSHSGGQSIMQVNQLRRSINCEGQRRDDVLPYHSAVQG